MLSSTLRVPALATRWGQVAILAGTEVTSWGILYYSFPVFLAPMQHELHWSQTTLTAGYSLGLLVSGGTGLFVGRWLDRLRNPRWLMTGGALAAVGALIVWAHVQTPLAFFGAWVVLGVAMAATLYEPAFTAVTAWFPRRERALTVLTTIGGLASVIYLPVAALLVQHLGWRHAVLVLAGLVAVGVVLPHALLLRPFPPVVAPANAAMPVVAWRHWRFWQLIVAFVLAQCANTALMVHLVPFLTQRQLSVPLAATVTGLIGGVSLIGRMIATWRSTAQTRARMTALVFVLQALGISILVLVSGGVGVLLFLLLFGAGFGVISPARAGLVADRFGVQAYGRINGQLALAVTLARAMAPTGASLVLSRWDSYPLVFGLLILLSLVGAIVLMLPERRP